MIDRGRSGEKIDNEPVEGDASIRTNAMIQSLNSRDRCKV